MLHSKFHTDSRVEQDTLKEGWELHHPKPCKNNIRDENSSLNDPSQKLFRTMQL